MEQSKRCERGRKGGRKRRREERGRSEDGKVYGNKKSEKRREGLRKKGREMEGGRKDEMITGVCGKGVTEGLRILGRNGQREPGGLEEERKGD